MEIQTERLYIRSLFPTDWEQMQKIFIDFSTSKYAIYDAPFPNDKHEIQTLTRRFADSNLFFAVFQKNSSEMLGYVCFHEDHGIYDLGFCFHSVYHARGYAFEATSTMMKYLLQNHRVKGFTAGTALDNAPSCALLKKLGFICQAIQSLSFHKDSHGKDIVFQGGNFVWQENLS